MPKLKFYRVVWEIEGIAAADPTAAAQKALAAIHKGCTCFSVTECGKSKATPVDLEEVAVEDTDA